jgi:dipeptidase E
MKFYISSFKIGDVPNRLVDLFNDEKTIAYISNALDFAKPESKQKHVDWDINDLTLAGFEVMPIDLKDYFGKQEEFQTVFEHVQGVYVSGGNTYDLRRAMQLSGFDDILIDTLLPTNFVYAGYSAAGCVLSKTLKGYDIVDDPNLHTFGDYETMWEGLGIIDWQFAPHFDSDHHESEEVNKEIEYCEQHGMPYKKLRDGEVIIFEKTELSL